MNRFYHHSVRLSDWTANNFGHPIGQVLILLASAIALLAGASMNQVMLALALVSLSLTQMVLNQQRRHDAALHLKLDELIRTHDGARDELTGVEHRTEDELRALRLDGEDV